VKCAYIYFLSHRITKLAVEDFVYGLRTPCLHGFLDRSYIVCAVEWHAICEEFHRTRLSTRIRIKGASNCSPLSNNFILKLSFKKWQSLVSTRSLLSLFVLLNSPMRASSLGMLPNHPMDPSTLQPPTPQITSTRQ
jgi:hypothetical protein